MRPPLSRPRLEFVTLLIAGLLLAGNAGYINTIVLALGAPPVTHLTGSVSRLSSDIGRTDLQDALLILSIVAAFFCGAALSGCVIGVANLRVGRRYGVGVMIEAGLLATAALVLPSSLIGGAVFASAAAGLQNGMASSYRSLIVRTTHITGIVTDLGFLTGKRLGGHRVEPWRFVFLGSLLAAFVCGGIAGVLAHARMSSNALWIPAAGLAIGGATHFIARTRVRSPR